MSGRSPDSPAVSSGLRIRPWIAVAVIAVFLAIWTALFAALVSSHVAALHGARPAAALGAHVTAAWASAGRF